MSNLLERPLRRFSTRAAPPGVRVANAKFEAPPDGWRAMGVSRRGEALDQLDAQMLRVTDAAARGVTRRTLLRRAAGVGLAGGLLASDFLFRTDNQALARDPCGPLDFGCGPSPICDPNVCSDSGQCRENLDGVRIQCYASGVCCGPTSDNCWQECCGGRVKRCCDCCVADRHVGGGALCSGCSAERHKCICRVTLGNC